MNIDWPVVIAKFDAILERGLCTGVGTRNGQMCIEAAICAALGLPHNDDPKCVTESVRAYKIQLNDLYRWISPQSRAKGLRNLGIAQIGSKGVISDDAFKQLMQQKTIQVLIPTLFREIFTQSTPEHQHCRDAALRCEQSPTVSNAHIASAAADADATYVAIYAAAAAAYAASYAVHHAANAANYAADAVRDEKYLVLSAKLALEALQELKSPGCEFL